MDPLAREHLIEFYSIRLKLFGDSPEALRWTTEGQRKRYALLTEVAHSLDGASVLDYGCGKGDFHAFLKQKGVNVRYTGTDINPELLALAARKHPDGRFRVLDAEEEDPGEDFDYIFICGVFNNRVEGATESMMNVMRRLFPRARKALAVTALSSEDPRKQRDLNYVSPAELTRFALAELTPFVTLRHDRIPWDFTMFLYKRATDEAAPAPEAP
ncbi:MAG: class I SAM-dependent methyltransferase [Nitrospirota bacterium]|jgi:SAM-dependent methyltransferase